MKKNIEGIFICTLLVATVLPVGGHLDNMVRSEDVTLRFSEYEDIAHDKFIIKFIDRVVLGLVHNPNRGKAW